MVAKYLVGVVVTDVTVVSCKGRFSQIIWNEEYD